ncbi:MAG: hypothetical protein ACRDIB_10415, partial [Ardenticatenaceae bacterium]
VLAESVRLLLRRSDWGLEYSQRCAALAPQWMQIREEYIPRSLFTSLLTELQDLPMPVYEAEDISLAASGCQPELLAQYTRIEPINLFDIDKGLLYIRIGESGPGRWGGSHWEYTFEKHNGQWALVARKILGFS